MTDQQLINEGILEGKKSFDFLWNKVNKGFDFEKVYSVMKSLDWVWHFSEERYGIPDTRTIAAIAKDLMKSAYEDGKQHSTGGFCAGWEGSDMFLVFQVEEFCTCDL